MEEGILITDAELSKALRDVVSCDEFTEACGRLGLVPPGPEVDEAEHVASHLRAFNLAPVIDRLMAKTVAASDVWYLTQYLDEGDEVDSDAMAMFRQLALRSAIATLGQLAEEGAVSVTSPRIRTITFRRPS